MIEDYTNIFRQKLSGQAEVCARKTLEWLQKDLQGPQTLEPSDVYHLATAAKILLAVRDQYGEK
jgi:hypothetical protein